MCRLDEGSNLRIRQLAPGIEVAKADGLRETFKPHQHDCYVLGITEHGVQRFRYRGAQLSAVPGQAFAIHPGETHDGQPGSEIGYGYRAVYITPELVSDALEASNAPFVRDAIGRDRAFSSSLRDFFELTDLPECELAITDCLARLADAMNRLSHGATASRIVFDRQLADRIRDDLAEHAKTKRSMSDLEKEYGLNRFAITRLFRKRFGVSPQQFTTNRRVAKARELITNGCPLAQAATASGFADQSHMTRQFVKTTGITPNVWRKLASQSGGRADRHNSNV